MKNLRLRVELLILSALAVYGTGCGCETPEGEADPWCGHTTVENMTEDMILVFPVLPGDTRNPDSSFSKAQAGASLPLFDATTIRVLDQHASLTEDLSIPPGAQGAAVALDEEGDAIPGTMSGIPVRQGDFTYRVLDFQPAVEDNPLFIDGGGGGPVP
jgi:hypothetical protein